jgi:transcriptional regulator with XRE-family HTH domain
MNEVQLRISKLQKKGWTLASIADGVGVTVNAVEKWKSGDRFPANAKAIFIVLDQLSQRPGSPKKRRCTIAR